MMYYSETEKLAVDMLEEIYVGHSVAYKYNDGVRIIWPKYDFNIFSNYLQSEVYIEYYNKIYKYLKPLNNKLVHSFLSLSILQFKTNTPDKRIVQIEKLYLDERYVGYRSSPYKLPKAEKYFFDKAFEQYTKNFHLFQKIIEDTYADYRVGLLGGTSPMETTNSIIKTNQSKIKTTLTVPQIAYLFKLLLETTPSIFDVKSKAELQRFISESYSTVGTEDKPISTEKLKQLFSNPDPDAVEFWKKHVLKMLSDIQKF